MKFNGLVYSATNRINGKRYIGQTVRDLERRKQEHISNANNDAKYAIHQAIVKYGEDNFTWEVLGTAKSIEELDEKEMYWIKHYNTYGTGGYNMAVGGQSSKHGDPDKISQQFGGKEFLVYDLNGKLVKSAWSQTAFAEEIGVAVQSVNNVLRGKKNSVKRLILIFKEDFCEDLLEERLYKANEGRTGKVFYVFEKNGDFIGAWNNREKCGNEIRVSRITITRNLEANNRGGRSKYLFYYKENLPKQLKSKISELEVS